MARKKRGLLIFSILMGTAGVLFLLWGLNIDTGKWWPVFFFAIGLASFARGIRERVNVIAGLLIMFWSCGAIAALHHETLDVNGIPFFIGIFILSMPLAWFIGRLLTPEPKA
ncbi:MAG: hypothetical protein H8D05_00780 [FCB group bacterium]|nr:hypothetical protein [FCB group bacterium]